MENFVTRKNELEQKGVEFENDIALLTKHNADIIENLIKNDDDCFPFAECIFEYYKLKGKEVDTDKKALWAVLREIDRDNSTNAWRFSKNEFNRIVEYIATDKNFFENLKKGDVNLPDKLVINMEKNLKSFSSKICKFLFDYIYTNTDNPYYIYDSVIRKKLLVYLNYYKVCINDELKEFINEDGTIRDTISYKELYGWLVNLHNARNRKYGDKITKNELDHIIWYTYRKLS